MRPHATNPAASQNPLYSTVYRTLSGLLMGIAIVYLSSSTALAKHVNLSAEMAYAQAKSGEIILVDIRTPREWRDTGIGEGAIGLDMTANDFVDALLKIRVLNPDTPIALICATGGRSGYVDTYLEKNGFLNTADVPEGMLGSKAGPGWLKTKLPIYPGDPTEITARRNAVLQTN